MNVNLDTPGRIAQVDEVTLAHVAMRGNPSRGAERFSFLEFRADFSDRAVCVERRAKWIDASRAQVLELLAPEGDQFIFVFHWRANVNRRTGFATSNREIAWAAWPQLVGCPILVCQANTGNEILGMRVAPDGERRVAIHQCLSICHKQLRK